MAPEIDLAGFVRHVGSEHRIRRNTTLLATFVALPFAIAVLSLTTFSPPILYFTVVIFVALVVAVHAWCRRWWTARCDQCNSKMRRHTADIDPVDVGPKLFWNGCHKIDGRFYSWASRPNEVRRLVRIVGVCNKCQSFAVISKLEYLEVEDQPRLTMLSGTSRASKA